MYRGNGTTGTNGFLLPSLPVQTQQLCLGGNVMPVVPRGLELKNNMSLLQGVGQGGVLGIQPSNKAACQMPFVQSPLPSSPQSHDTSPHPLGFPLSPLSRTSAPAPTTPTAHELQTLQEHEDQEEEARLVHELNTLQVPDEGTFARWQAAHRNKILKEASVKLASLQAAQSYVESRIDSDHAICNGAQHVPKIAEACKFYRMACGCTRTQCPYEHETTLKRYLYETRRQKVIDELIHGKMPECKREPQPVLNQQQMEAISLISGSSRKQAEPLAEVKREAAAVEAKRDAMVEANPEAVDIKQEAIAEEVKCDDDEASQPSVHMDDEDDGCFVVNFGGFPNERRRNTPTPPPPEPSPLKSEPRQATRNEKREQALAILQAPRTAVMSSMQSQRDALDRQLEEFQKRAPTGKRSRSEENESHGSQRRKL